MKRFLLCLMLMLSLGVASGFSQKPFTMNINGESLTAEASDLKPFVFPGLDMVINMFNEQAPMTVDDHTALIHCSRTDTELFYNYEVDFDRNDFSDEAIASVRALVKRDSMQMIYSMLQAQSEIMPESEWVRLFKELGIKYNYKYLDKNGNLFMQFDVDFSDF